MQTPVKKKKGTDCQVHTGTWYQDRLQRTLGRDASLIYTYLPEASYTDAKLKEYDVVAGMEAVKNVVAPSLSNNAGHLEAWDVDCGNVAVSFSPNAARKLPELL